MPGVGIGAQHLPGQSSVAAKSLRTERWQILHFKGFPCMALRLLGVPEQTMGVPQSMALPEHKPKKL